MIRSPAVHPVKLQAAVARSGSNAENSADSAQAFKTTLAHCTAQSDAAPSPNTDSHAASKDLGVKDKQKRAESANSKPAEAADTPQPASAVPPAAPLPGDSIALLQTLTALAAQSTQVSGTESLPGQIADTPSARLSAQGIDAPTDTIGLASSADGHFTAHARLDLLRLHAGREPHTAGAAASSPMSGAAAGEPKTTDLGMATTIGVPQPGDAGSAASIAQLHLTSEASASAIATADATPATALSAASAAANMQTPAVPMNAGTAASTEIHAAFGARSWNNEIVASVNHFVMDKIEVAEIRLNPADMGPVRVEIAYDQGQAAVHFTAQREETRDALAQNFDRLRESLAESGVTLSNASTGSFGDGRAFNFMQQQAQSSRQRSNARDAALTANTPPMLGSVGIGRATAKAARGNVDLFA